MHKNNFAILMAGGVGSRFWPVSTTEFPKQFHDMLGTGETLIQKTFSRLSHFVPAENIFILTNALYKDLVLSQLPQIKENQVLLEPAMRNTAPCILYAALKIYQLNQDAQIVVAPSDHWIEDENAFTQNIHTAIDFCAKNNVLMTLGIIPTFANTGYGYIEFDKCQTTEIKKVIQFREKPDYQTAKSFLESKNFWWNAGIFIWSATSIIEAFQNLQPIMYALFEKGKTFYNTPQESHFIKENYALAENISIDYAILEKAKNVHILGATFDWNDLGTWGSLYDKLHKDTNENATVNASVFAENAQGNIIRTDAKKLVVVDGISNYIIVDKEDVLLIYPKEKEQDIKQIVNKLNT
jgi:mannose-1-phosphate guanylyltransferase